MAEYWKSQPKKMCEFCKCWITDNKASIEFHERGKKHKENVQKRIQEVQKKGKETSQAQKQLQMDLEAIEAAALKAYEKDLNIEPSKSNPESNAKSQKTQTNETCSNGESSAGCVISYDGQMPIMNCNHGWNIAQAPEGYYYYYNTATQASQWESPSCLLTPSNQDTRNVKEDNGLSKEEESSSQIKIEENQVEGEEKKQVKNSPYGQWTTVQTFEPAPQTAKSASASESEIRKTTTTEPNSTVVKFRERSTPKITFRSVGDGNEVAFKKRKLNPEKKRNIRQTDPNKTS